MDAKVSGYVKSWQALAERRPMMILRGVWGTATAQKRSEPSRSAVCCWNWVLCTAKMIHRDPVALDWAGANTVYFAVEEI